MFYGRIVSVPKFPSNHTDATKFVREVQTVVNLSGLK